MTCLPNFAFYAFTAFFISLASFNSALLSFLNLYRNLALSTNVFLLRQLNQFFMFHTEFDLFFITLDISYSVNITFI